MALTSNKYYTYIYLDPRKAGSYKYTIKDGTIFEFSNEPFYVGKGQGKRDKHHLYLRNSTKTHNKYLTSKISKIIKETSLEPIIIKIAQDLDEEKSFIIEKELIKLIGRKDLGLGTLCNHTDGGDGESGKITTIKQRTHKTVFKKGQTPWNKGVKGYKMHSEEFKNSLVNRLTGVPKSDESRLKSSKSHGGLPILQYDLQGNFIKEWETGRSCILAGYKAVSNTLFHKRHFANGFLWYKKESNDINLKVDAYVPTRYSSKKYKICH